MSVGLSKKRKDAVSKVIGKEKFADDYYFPDMLSVYTLRSPKPYIKIKRLDISKAEKIPGVIKVITYKDIPGKNEIPLVFNDYPCLANKETKFHGQAIALVAAESISIAKKAAKLIKLEYTEKKGVFDPLEAMKKNAPLLYGNNNIFKKFQIIKGDIKTGFKQSDYIIKQQYYTNYQVHTYMETQGMVALKEGDGSITVYGSMQCPFYVLDAVSHILGLTKNKVKIIQSGTGGGFGGKEDVPSIVASHTALATYLTGQPAKLIYNREEDFQTMSKRHPSYTTCKYGVKKDGRIVAAEVKYVIDGGAYSTLSPIVLWRGTVHAAGPYEIPHVKINTFAVATNKVPCGAYRGFGQPQVSFAHESLIDEIAEKCRLIPLQVRKINGLKKGRKTATNYSIKVNGTPSVLNEVIKKSNYLKVYKHWNTKKSDVRKGIGLSLTYYGVGLGAAGKHLSRAGAFLQVENDGSVRLAFGNTEMGQGAKTVLAQITAQALNAPYDMIYVLDPDTSRVPDSGPTVASRTTFMSGNAILKAAKPIFNNLRKAAAVLLQCKVSQVKYHNTKFIYGNRMISYVKTVKQAHQMKLQMSFEGWYVPPNTSFDNAGQGSAYYSYTFSANAVLVSVNMKTGHIKVEKIYSAHDVGKAVNPQLVEGQIEGGVTQGLGYASMENLVIRNGYMLNPNFTGYIIPTIKDMPKLYPIIVENKDPLGPYGARGFGEPPLIGIAPAVANAVYNACGIRIFQTPILPEMIIEKIKGKKDE